LRLVFLHGGGLNAEMWRPQRDGLADEFDVVAVDLPGHGTRSQERFSFPASIATVQDAVGPSGAVLVGLSLGGYVAMAATAQQESLAAGLVLTGCSVDYSRLGGRMVAATGELFQRMWPKRMLRQAQSTAFRKRYPEWAEGIVNAGQSWRGYADALRAARRIHWRECLSSYTGPVLVLNGALDRPHVQAQEDLVARLPHARAETIAAAGHMANLDQPDAYTDAVRSFARGVVDGESTR
jgi:pimeloyl-ACP methyl ester carboxylesterase